MEVTLDERGDYVCEHGTAMDVHCCNCHNGFIFDLDHECDAVEEEPLMRVFICDKDHPHAGEVGTMTGKIISVLGTPMAEVKLDHCRHGTDGCFVKKGQVLSEDEFYRRRDRPKG